MAKIAEDIFFLFFFVLKIAKSHYSQLVDNLLIITVLSKPDEVKSGLSCIVHCFEMKSIDQYLFCMYAALFRFTV